MATVDSTSDARTANNVMRHEYRVLSEAEKQDMKRLKGIGAEFISVLNGICDRDGHGNFPPDLRNAADRVQEAVM